MHSFIVFNIKSSTIINDQHINFFMLCF